LRIVCAPQCFEKAVRAKKGIAAPLYWPEALQVSPLDYPKK
jgi:hypothetical protein